ncbi:hypothetical protein BaRGS_00008178, partial [Batillaria attramentaria]
VHVTLLILLCLGGPSFGQDSVLVISGDVTLGAMFTVNELENGQCGDVDITSLQEVVAVTWLVEQLNAADYVPGFRIGLRVTRTCNMPEMAVKGAVDLVTNYTDTSSALLLAVLGPSRTAEATVVSRFLGSLPAHQRLLQISGASTGKELSDKTLYPNFFRVIPPDTVQVQVMLELLEQLEWNYVAIVYDEDDYGRSAATELRRLAKDRQICVPVFEGMPTDTGSGDFSTAIERIANQMKSNGLIRGVVIIGGYLTSNKLLNKLSAEAKFVSVILSEAVGLQSSALETTSGQPMAVARGALVTSPQYFVLPEFRAFWNRLWITQTTFATEAGKNPWLAEYFRQIAGCDVGNPGCWESADRQRADLTIPDGSPDEDGIGLYVWYEMKATAVMATLLKQVHQNQCGASRGVCTSLRNFIRQRTGLEAALRTATITLTSLSSTLSTFANVTSLTFNAGGDVRLSSGGGQYTVYNFQKKTAGSGDFIFRQVGLWSGDTLTVDKTAAQFYNETGGSITWGQLPPAQCDVDHDCLQCESDVSDDVIFIQGDFYVVAIVPVHEKPSDSLLKCGGIKTVAGADLAQSVIFAVKSINEKRGQFRDVLPGRSVGLVVINSCSSPLLVRQRLLDLHSGRLILPGGRNTSSIVSKIMGYAGAYNSGNSIAASETLNDIGRTFVQVSGVSTSPALKDRARFPYFMRIVPPDDTQARVLMEILAKLGISYIQVIYDSTTTYAVGLYNAIVDELKTGRYDVCIAQAIPVKPQNEASLYTWVLDKLRSKSSAKMVIIIQHIPEILKVMEATLPVLSSSDGFVFFGTDSWGRRQYLIEGKPKLVGSLALSQELAVDKPFENYFEDVDPLTTANPWLKYFWEKRENCYLNKSFQRAGKAGPCPDSFNYVQDPRVPFYINIVNGLVLGFSQALSDHCGTNAMTVCDSLTSEQLVEAMKNVRLDLYSTNRLVNIFDSNGDGVVGYKVLQVKRDLTSSSGGLTYGD